MGYRELADHLYSNKSQVMETVQDIFGVHSAPTPNIVIGPPSCITLPDFTQFPELSMGGAYNEIFDGLILINLDL